MNRVIEITLFCFRSVQICLDGQNPDQNEIDRASVISAMNRAKKKEAAEATTLIRKVLSPAKPIPVLSSSVLRSTSLSPNGMNVASSCPSNLSIVEKQPDVVLDTKTSKNQMQNNKTNEDDDS